MSDNHDNTLGPDPSDIQDDGLPTSPQEAPAQATEPDDALTLVAIRSQLEDLTSLIERLEAKLDRALKAPERSQASTNEGFRERGPRSNNQGGFERGNFERNDNRDRGGFDRPKRGFGRDGFAGNQDRGGFSQGSSRGQDRGGFSRGSDRNDNRGGFGRGGGFERNNDSRGGFSRGQDQGGFTRGPERNDSRGPDRTNSDNRGGFNRNNDNRGGFERKDHGFGGRPPRKRFGG